MNAMPASAPPRPSVIISRDTAAVSSPSFHLKKTTSPASKPPSPSFSSATSSSPLWWAELVRASRSAIFCSTNSVLGVIRSGAPSYTSSRAPTLAAVSSLSNSTNAEPRKSLDSMWRRRRTQFTGPCCSKNSVICSSVAVYGKGPTYSERASAAWIASFASASSVLRLTLVPSSLTVSAVEDALRAPARSASVSSETSEGEAAEILSRDRMRENAATVLRSTHCSGLPLS
mmetsp:Transcript_29764/g.76925  ORF Transcript_29764/g.76925 Transcript_29764/m.76925 type:complete len:230 (+) Transcript_29764:21-710(+)